MTNENELKVGEVKKFERHICDPEIWEGEMSCKLPCVDELYRLIEDVPEHIKLSGWFYSKPMFGTQGVYAESFSGNGRQHIMNLPASKAYFGGLAQYIAAVNPRAIKILLDRIKSQQAELEAAQKEIERYEAGPVCSYWLTGDIYGYQTECGYRLAENGISRNCKFCGGKTKIIPKPEGN